MSKEIIINTLAIDFGNGNIKITADGKNVEVIPAVYSYTSNSCFSLTTYDDVFKMNEREVIIGNEAMSLPGRKIGVVNSENDLKRYEENSYYDMIFNSILLHFKCRDIKVKKILCGLPNAHYKSASKIIKNKLEKTKKVNLKHNNKECSIKINKVVVLPQPIGTYFHLLAQNKINVDDNKILIIDGGFGTVDITEIENGHIADSFGNELGVRQLLSTMYSTLKDKWPGIQYTVYELDKVLKNQSFKYGGKVISLDEVNISELKELQLEKILTTVREKYAYLEIFDLVIFTGGLAKLLEQQINSKKQKNYMVLKDSQTANVKGFYFFGERR